jgi:diguanylate cyclase (GGDEF)-like protein
LAAAIIEAMEHASRPRTLLEATQVVARGGDLGQKLDALAGQAVASIGVSAAVVYLYDPATRRLEPVAQAGLDPQALAEAEPVAADDDQEIVARALRERRSQRATEERGSRALQAQGQPIAGLIAVPIIAADEAGNEDVEGALLASLGGGGADYEDRENALGALADLCAVAIRQAQLENALVERADWIGRLATTDPLTGLANRVTFDRMLELEVARAARQETPLSIVLFTVVGLAGITSEAGAEASDDVLRHVASTLAEQVRLVDTIARFDARSFGLIAPGSGGAVVGERVRAAAAAIEARPGRPIELAVSVAVYPAEGATGDELLAAAEAGNALSGVGEP